MRELSAKETVAALNSSSLLVHGQREESVEIAMASPIVLCGHLSLAARYRRVGAKLGGSINSPMQRHVCIHLYLFEISILSL